MRRSRRLPVAAATALLIAASLPACGLSAPQKAPPLPGMIEPSPAAGAAVDGGQVAAADGGAPTAAATPGAGGAGGTGPGSGTPAGTTAGSRSGSTRTNRPPAGAPATAGSASATDTGSAAASGGRSPRPAPPSRASRANTTGGGSGPRRDAGSVAAHASAAARPTLTMTATAYGPGRRYNHPYGSVDYFGKPLVPGDVAVDPRVIPLGTRLFVSGYRSPYLPRGGFLAVARDEGAGIKGRRIAIFIDASPRAVGSFGIQRVRVSILSR